ncbi:MAG: hypothetical protein HY841_01020 [Bacteroidetes bacterium]|nr:hypothetical protein [Bacteroidota bacterium]
MATVNISRNPEQLLNLSENIIKKHKKDGGKSALTGMNMSDMEKITIETRKKYDEAIELRKRSEKLTEEVQKLLGIHKKQKTTQPGHILYYCTQVRDILKGIFRATLKKLCDWGFIVNDGGGNNKPQNP